MQKEKIALSNSDVKVAENNLHRFFRALSFLTIFPAINLAGEKEAFTGDMGKSSAYFSLVGFFIGTVLWATVLILNITNLNALIKATLIVLTLITITGGLHLDGLADTFDGLGSGWSKERSLEIMKSGDIGPFGVTALVLSIILKISILSVIIQSSVFYWLLIVPALSRWSMVFSMVFQSSARADGLGKIFIDGSTAKELAVSTIVVLTMLVYFELVKLLLLIAAVLVAVLLLNSLFKRKFGGITGDTLGAQCEIVEILALLIVALLI